MQNEACTPKPLHHKQLTIACNCARSQADKMTNRFTITVLADSTACLTAFRAAAAEHDIVIKAIEPARPRCPSCGRACVVVRSTPGEIFMKQEFGCRACKYHSSISRRVPLTECKRHSR